MPDTAQRSESLARQRQSTGIRRSIGVLHTSSSRTLVDTTECYLTGQSTRCSRYRHVRVYTDPSVVNRTLLYRRTSHPGTRYSSTHHNQTQSRRSAVDCFLRLNCRERMPSLWAKGASSRTFQHPTRARLEARTPSIAKVHVQDSFAFHSLERSFPSTHPAVPELDYIMHL